MSEQDSNERTFTLEKSEEDNNLLLIESEPERNIELVSDIFRQVPSGVFDSCLRETKLCKIPLKPC